MDFYIGIALTVLTIVVAIIFLKYKFRPQKAYAHKCGHRLYLRNGKFKVTALGKTVAYSAGRQDVIYCPACLAKMVIQCLWCQRPIFPGDSVCVFESQDSSAEIPEHAHILTGRPMQVISCTQPDCLKKSHGEINGIWTSFGEVEKISS